MKTQLTQKFVANVLAAGYRVWLAERGDYGFYTDEDGARTASFQVEYGQIRLSGNYAAARGSGTGWQIGDYYADDATPDHLRQWLYARAPSWANTAPVYSTCADQLARYGASSKYKEVLACPAP